MGFDGACCLKWFSGDGSSVWCQWDKGDAWGAEGWYDVLYTANGWQLYRTWGVQAEWRTEGKEKKVGGMDKHGKRMKSTGGGRVER